MKRFSKREILSEINNGNEEVLVYLSRKYFSTARRLLRLRGFRDELTPAIFCGVLATVYTDLRRRQNEHIDFETYFINALNEEIRQSREKRKINIQGNTDASEVAAQCVSILDEQSQKLIFARIAEKLSYERITDKFQFSNPVIAQYEVNKAFNQLEGIIKLRMNISQN